MLCMQKFNLSKIYQSYKDNGYVILENVIDYNTTKKLQSFIQKQIAAYAEELKISFAQYTYCTGRWGPASKFFVNTIFSDINNKLKQTLEAIFNKNIILQKQNMICKNQYVTDELALHQDISYSYNSPYNFSLWLALDDILPGSGEMMVIPKSHKWPIAGAVDFWSPFFKDKKLKKYEDKIQKIYLKTGSCLLFDSRLWHGSLANITKSSRYAYVTRWLMETHQFSKIPKPQKLNFGMWDCYEQLTKILLNFSNNNSPENPSFVTLLNNTKMKLITYNTLHKKCISAALSALNDLIILHQASDLHDAGDLCGNIYKKVWYNLLPVIIKIKKL